MNRCHVINLLQLHFHNVVSADVFSVFVPTVLIVFRTGSALEAALSARSMTMMTGNGNPVLIADCQARVSQSVM